MKMEIELAHLDAEHLQMLTLTLARVSDTMTRLTRAKMNGKETFGMTEKEIKDFNFISLGLE